MRKIDFYKQIYLNHSQGNSEQFFEFMRKDLWSAVSAAEEVGITLDLVKSAATLAPELYRSFWRPDRGDSGSE